MTRDPWMKFYPSDWRSDPRLRMCSPAARGLWIDMLCLMHEADPYGHLLISGNVPTDAQLSMVTATPAEQLPDLIAELEAAGVFSRNRRGVIYSRRMTRDEKKRRTARENGKNGGNPKLGNKRENPASDNPPLKPQKPESRSQKEETTLRVVARASDPPCRKHRIPEEAVPSDRDYAAAERRSVSREEADHEYERFKNYHLARGNTFKDWHRAWLTWLDSPLRKQGKRRGDPDVEARSRRAAEYARTMF